MEHCKKRYSLLKKIKYYVVVKQLYLLVFFILLYTLSLFTQRLDDRKYLPKNVKAIFEQLINNLEKDFELQTLKTVKLSSADTNNQLNCIADLVYKPYGIFLYKIDDNKTISIKGWSNNKYHIKNQDINLKDTSYLVNYENGYFEVITKKIILKNKQYVWVGLIPIEWNFFIKNKYLNTNFTGFDNLHKYYQISTIETNLAINNNKGQHLFYLKKIQEGYFFEYSWLTIIIRGIAICFLLYFIKIKFRGLIHKFGFYKSFISFTLLIIFIRILAYTNLNFPFDNSKLSLFDPSIYASNFIHPSLGDLLVNICLFIWLLIFYKKNNLSFSISNNSNIQKFIAISNIFILVLVTFFFNSVLKSLVVDSKISFDVGNFFSLTIYSGVAFIVICLISICCYKLSTILLHPVIKLKISLLNQCLTVIIAAILIIIIDKKHTDLQPVIIVSIILCILAYIIIIQKSKIVKESFKNSMAIFPMFWILFFSTIASALIVSYNRVLEIEQRKKIAEKIYLQTDAVAENLLNIATTGFSDNFFSKNFSRFNNQKNADFIKDSLLAENFSGYLNKYQTKIYLFDKNNISIFNTDTTSIKSLNTFISFNGKPIGTDGLFSTNTNSLMGNSYVFKKDVTNTNNQLLCKLFIIIKPKNNKTKGVFPELFKQWQDADFQTSYPYAFYENEKLIEQNGNYNFLQTQLKINTTFGITTNENQSILIYQPNNQSSVLVVKNIRYLLDFITLFAYLFFTFFFVILVLFIVEKITIYHFSLSTILKQFDINIRYQIRATIIFISVFSFLIIGLVTIRFFIDEFKEKSQDRLVKSISYSATEIENYSNNNDTIDVKKIENLLSKLSEQQNLDINLFDSIGILTSTTQPYIYNKKLVDTRINPVAFNKIYANRELLFTQQELIGSLSYLSLYKPIKNKAGNVIYCINIPYLNSQSALNQEISGFIATLINLNAFIFLIAGAIAYSITNKITASFKLIKDKMKAINWQTQNEEIVWTKNDEIGALVNEYNIMVRKLDETAKAFAISQQEKAWKEMAKQVAHEIKNPLTPMKLSIQYLKKNIDENAPNVKEISKKVAATLIEQIDQLANIAGDFSQFANIGNTDAENINLNNVLQGLVNLYNVETNVRLVYNYENQSAIIFADKTQMIRLFTNIIKNAIEATQHKEITLVTISQICKNNKVTIAIKDDGTGILDEMQSKIFTVNFTTKSSGTGLGLAICKGIVENANGNIWFETSQNGTIFYIEFPLVNS